MRKQLPSVAAAACIGALSSLGVTNVEAKQQCSAAVPSNPNGKWWSYRIIDGRKCWYEGKPMLSKSLLEWPKNVPARPLRKDVVNVISEQRASPLNAQAWAKDDPDSFEALWRARIIEH
jgi:hypothetical protein